MINWLNRIYHKATAPKEWHPKNDLPIVFAFRCGITDYYHLANDAQIPAKRWAYLRQYFHEMEMRMTRETLLEFVTAIEKAVNPGKGESIEIGKIDRLAKEMKDRTEWLFEPETLYRMASVVYFPLNEDIADYDERFNARKINHFKKKELMPFFLKKLNENTNGLLNMSTEDLQAYSQKVQAIAKAQQEFTDARNK